MGEDENEARRRKHEKVKTSLENASREHVLYACLLQGPDEYREVGVRVEPMTSHATVAKRKLPVQDGGGICRASMVDGYGRDVQDEFLAILEAKRYCGQLEKA